MGRISLRSAVAAWVALPPLAMAAATLAMLGLAALGVHPFWPHQELTVQEAAQTGNDAAVARLFMRGADPNAPGLVFGDSRLLTPLEAAVDSRQAHTVKTVLKYGAEIEGDAGRAAVCRAYAHAEHLLPLLKAEGAPPIEPSMCPQ
jgi:hypothetical protein